MPVLARILIGVPVAAVLALALFLGMHVAIRVGSTPLSEALIAKRVEPGGQTDVDILSYVSICLDCGPLPVPRPAPPSIAPHADAAGAPTASSYPAVRPATLPAADPITPAFDGRTSHSADWRPVLSIAPAYPPRLIRRGVEGQCVIGFDIGAGGATQNVRALSCTTPALEKPALRAVESWRYRPGETAEDRQVTIEFKLVD